MTRRGASTSDIVALAAELAGVPRGQVDRDDLLASPGMDARTASRFLRVYAGRFGVDMRGYRWWFHHRDHGALAMPLVALDGERREIRIALSAEMPAAFAERGRWDIAYPPHRLGLSSGWWAVVVFGILALGLIYAIAP